MERSPRTLSRIHSPEIKCKLVFVVLDSQQKIQFFWFKVNFLVENMRNYVENIF
jgi:hypothetical protein